MKKLSILFVIAIFCLTTTTTFAQESKEEVKKVAKKEMKAKKDYAEIAAADLPEAVQATLKESFADYNVKKAYKTKADNGNVMYYAKVEKDGKWLKVGLDANGKVLKKKEIHKKHKKEKHSK